MNAYKEFLEQKAISDPATGIKDVTPLNPMLMDFQRDMTSWALRRGRAAMFADCGMGKTPMQLEWAKHIPGRVLILAPLAVSQQTVREGEKFGVGVSYARSQQQSDNGKRITITNYEMLDKFNIDVFEGVVLDESSILKSFDGTTRTQIIESFRRTAFKLACTATPAPNDYMELGNHAEFIGAMTRAEMLAMFFVHDGAETQKWRIKGHAEKDFWTWLCSWAVMIRKPSDLGYDDGPFVLPPIHYHSHVVRSSKPTDGYLIPLHADTLQERLAARRSTITERVEKCAELVNADKEPWLVWCNLNAESEELRRAIPDAIEVKGSDSMEHKEDAMLGFSSGKYRVLVSKGSICGWGMNWQHARNQAFVGLSDSWETYYQCVRREWRFGQKRECHVHIITADTEGAVVENIKRKELDADNMAKEMVKHMQDLNAAAVHGGTVRSKSEYKRDVKSGDGWTIHLADCVEAVSEIRDDSIHFSIFSPPFASLYTYSNSERDMGNCKDADAFVKHFGFLVKELYRATMPGRLVSFHCMNLPTSKTRDGVIGISDFRGDLIRLFESDGWIYHSEVCIWKDPVTAMQRTKALGLLHKQIKKDSCMSRQGIADYLVTMRKPGENPERVTHTNETFPVQKWQNYASPVWMDIDPSDTLQYRSARENNDERHVCPLQLQVIRRAVELWTNPGDLVLSPFAGIGSEGVVALEMGRKFIGVELKESYWKCAVRNLEAAESERKGSDLFSRAS